jgi:hypothetical protein
MILKLITPVKRILNRRVEVERKRAFYIINRLMEVLT